MFIRTLKYGALPKILMLKTDSAKRKTLETYALTYIHEEIRAEQVVRSLDPFRKYLEVAAQGNGKIIHPAEKRLVFRSEFSENV